MFQTAAGVTVPFPEKLSEQYELDGNTITANLSFEKLSDFVHSFYADWTSRCSSPSIRMRKAMRSGIWTA
ncbi:MAG: hypothetical protein ACLUDF_01290 [Butyricicoccus sp.]